MTSTKQEKGRREGSTRDPTGRGRGQTRVR